jgi:CubicO group peptidase (beta-lactamase class C family)
VNVGSLEEALVTEQARFNDVGFAVAVVKDDEVVLERGFGLRDKDAQLPATERTLFAIGSSTKAFTATVIAALVGDGKLEWDKPVREYLPYFKLQDPVASELITPRDLLCHNSGLPRHDLLWYGNYSASRRELIERLRYLEPTKTFREVWQYNNLMYMTAGHLAGETLGGISWEDAVRQRLLEPLGMTRTGFSVQEMSTADDWSKAYKDDDGKQVELPLRDLGVCGPAGSINSCVRDMVAWLRVNLSEGRLGDQQVIAADAVKTMHAVHMHMPGGGLDDLFPERQAIGYGLGWFIESYRGERIVHHGGNIDGFSAMVMFAPRRRAGVVVLTNGNGTFLRDVAAYRVMDELFGLEPLPWGERFHQLITAMKAGGKQAKEHRDANRIEAPASRPIEAFAGRYRNPGYGDVEFVLDGGKLRARYNSHDVDVEHRHYDVFELKFTQPQEGAIPATFTGDTEGEIAAVQIPFEGTVKPIVFERVPPELSAADIAGFAGEYVMEPMRLIIELEGEALTGRLLPVSGGRFTLVPYRGTTFKVKEQESTTVEFVSGPDGDKAVVQPLGVFSRTK